MPDQPLQGSSDNQTTKPLGENPQSPAEPLVPQPPRDVPPSSGPQPLPPSNYQPQAPTPPQKLGNQATPPAPPINSQALPQTIEPAAPLPPIKLTPLSLPQTPPNQPMGNQPAPTTQPLPPSAQEKPVELTGMNLTQSQPVPMMKADEMKPQPIAPGGNTFSAPVKPLTEAERKQLEDKAKKVIKELDALSPNGGSKRSPLTVKSALIAVAVLLVGAGTFVGIKLLETQQSADTRQQAAGQSFCNVTSSTSCCINITASEVTNCVQDAYSRIVVNYYKCPGSTQPAGGCNDNGVTIATITSPTQNLRYCISDVNYCGSQQIDYGCYTSTTTNTLGGISAVTWKDSICSPPVPTSPPSNPTPTPTSTQPSPTPTKTPTPTLTPTPTPTLKPSPTPTPPLSCNSVCTTSAQCPSNLTCSAGRCRLPACVEQANCTCIPTPTPTPAIACSGVTFSNVNPVYGDTVTLGCVGTPAQSLAKADFRYSIDRGAWIPLTNTAPFSAQFTINQIGHYEAECRVCRDSNGTDCTAWQ